MKTKLFFFIFLIFSMNVKGQITYLDVNNDSVCVPGSATFTCTATNPNISSTDTATIFVWWHPFPNTLVYDTVYSHTQSVTSVLNVPFSQPFPPSPDTMYVYVFNENMSSQIDFSFITFYLFKFSASLTSQNATCGMNDGNIAVNVTSGVAPYTYSWSNGSTSSTITGLAPATYSVVISDAVGCSASVTKIVSTSTVAPTPSICMVTVDSLSQNNVILWDKTSFAPTDSFFVYREIGTNNYQLLVAVPYDSLSLFVDTVRIKYFPNTGDPNAGTYRYKIGIKDSCGSTSMLSSYHNTIYILNNSGAFSWTQLYTIENSANPVISYILMRDDNSTGAWHAVNSVSGTQQTVIDANYLTYQSTARWRVETQWSISCNPTRVNPTVASFNSSRSNIFSNVNAVNDIDLSNYLSVYPNPTNGMFTIKLEDVRGQMTDGQIEIYNVFGEKVYSKKVNRKQETVNLNWSDGIYFVRVEMRDGIANKKIIIQK